MLWKEYIDSLLTVLNSQYDADEANYMAKLLLEKRVPGFTFSTLKNASFEIADEIVSQLQIDIDLLSKATPIQYVMNESWFYKYPFYVDSSVLIPRPETEELVELTIKNIQALDTPFPLMLDIGTGSGCIAISIKKEAPHCNVIGVDVSKEALTVAKKNARSLSVNVDFLNIDILYAAHFFDQIPIDIIVSNPPYIPLNEQATMHSNVVMYEPHTALFVPDNNPLLFYDKIADLALQKKSIVCCEISESLGEQTKNLFLQKGFKDVRLLKDLQQKDRMIEAIP